jgi:hypothetical protein
MGGRIATPHKSAMRMITISRRTGRGRDGDDSAAGEFKGLLSATNRPGRDRARA